MVSGLGRVADLREYLARVPDPRRPRGIRHRLEAILGVAAVAVAAQARSLVAIGEWAADAPQWVLALLGVRSDPRGRFVAPDESTVRRVLAAIDGDALDEAISAWIRRHVRPVAGLRPAIAVDGKSVCGTFARTGGAGVHLLAAFTHHDGSVVAQQQVKQGTSEIAWFQPLLNSLDLTGRVLTADALHTTAAHARYLTSAGADYVLIVKRNHHRLHTLLRTTAWPNATHHTNTGIGHGRLEQRIIEVLPAPEDLDFPGAAQIFQITRYRTNRATGTRQTETIYGITSLTPHAAGPAHIAAYPRRPLADRKPTALGPRHHLRRRHLPPAHGHRTPRHGNLAQPRHQRTTPNRTHQHRRRTTPHGPQPNTTPTTPRNHHLTSNTRLCRNPAHRGAHPTLIVQRVGPLATGRCRGCG